MPRHDVSDCERASAGAWATGTKDAGVPHSGVDLVRLSAPPAAATACAASAAARKGNVADGRAVAGAGPGTGMGAAAAWGCSAPGTGLCDRLASSEARPGGEVAQAWASAGARSGTTPSSEVRVLRQGLPGAVDTALADSAASPEAAAASAAAMAFTSKSPNCIMWIMPMSSAKSWSEVPMS